tara:strand:+ start:1863 stop:2894 length:1032 start_codon:yes stop_codon:yes gene_type:complete
MENPERIVRIAKNLGNLVDFYNTNIYKIAEFSDLVWTDVLDNITIPEIAYMMDRANLKTLSSKQIRFPALKANRAKLNHLIYNFTFQKFTTRSQYSSLRHDDVYLASITQITKDYDALLQNINKGCSKIALLNDERKEREMMGNLAPAFSSIKRHLGNLLGVMKKERFMVFEQINNLRNLKVDENGKNAFVLVLLFLTRLDYNDEKCKRAVIAAKDGVGGDIQRGRNKKIFSDFYEENYVFSPCRIPLEAVRRAFLAEFEKMMKKVEGILSDFNSPITKICGTAADRKPKKRPASTLKRSGPLKLIRGPKITPSFKDKEGKNFVITVHADSHDIVDYDESLLD